MAEKTKIAWTDHTFNPWIGCSKVNEGCLNCYAENLMDRRYGRVRWGVNGTRSRTKTWGEPLKWNRAAQSTGTKHKVFCASLADVFEDRLELVPWRRELFQLIDKCQHLYWLLLTKRPENISSMWPDDKKRDNVWLGTSVAVQKNVEFVHRLLPSAKLCRLLFISLEPQVGPVSLSDTLKEIGWVISGGESDQLIPARPWNVNWGRVTKDECQEAGVPWFLKQYGSNPFDGTRRLTLKDKLHGSDPNEWEEQLRIRQCPETYRPEEFKKTNA